MKLIQTPSYFTEYSLFCKELHWLSSQIAWRKNLNSNSSLLTAAITSENVCFPCLYGSADRNTEKTPFKEQSCVGRKIDKMT